MKANRYFIVFYVCLNNRKTATGHRAFSSTIYPNRNEVVQEIINQGDGYNSEDVIITNIQELSKEDYEQFIK